MDSTLLSTMVLPFGIQNLLQKCDNLGIKKVKILRRIIDLPPASEDCLIGELKQLHSTILDALKESDLCFMNVGNEKTMAAVIHSKLPNWVIEKIYEDQKMRDAILNPMDVLNKLRDIIEVANIVVAVSGSSGREEPVDEEDESDVSDDVSSSASDCSHCKARRSKRRALKTCCQCFHAGRRVQIRKVRCSSYRKRHRQGDVYYINMITNTVLHKFRASRIIKCLQFSPDATQLAICRDNDLQIHKLGVSGNQTFYPFSLSRTYKLSSDTLNSLDWSFDSNLLVAGGEDKVIRVVGSRDFRNLYIHPLASHKGEIVHCQFMQKSYDMISVCKRGIANVWTCSIQPGELQEGAWKKDDDEKMETEDVEKLFFDKTKKYSLCESSGGDRSISVTAAKYHAASKILVTAFENGVFVLHEIPSFSLIHNLRVSDMKIRALSLNLTGDWIAIGCGKGSAAQLVVWEWQSETYVMKQQAHSLRITTCEYSPDGSLIGTGAEDGKVKIWNGRSSFCTVTFDEHTSAVTGVKWTQSGKAILSASLDGTVRAHDLKRYRNFRTMVCPEPTQLGCLAVDRAGDIVAAGAKEVFNIFLWSLESGHLLDILSGHESAIAAIDISGNQIVSASWDRTFKIWNIVDSQAETTELSHEAVDVRFSPAGDVVAVLTSDSVISLYEAKEMTFLGSIEAHLDLDPARGHHDTITKENAAKSKSFTCFRFSPDGNLILVGGESNKFCLYSVPDRIILKKFQITENRSLDGVVMDVNRRNFTEFGNIQLIDTSDDEDEDSNKKAIKLPGTKHFDLGERRSKPEVSVFAVAYCPTGRRFAVCSSEGVSIYSLDIVSIFDPFQLDTQTSPEIVRKALSMNDYTTALMASLRLGDSNFIADSLEMTSVTQIPLVVQSLPLIYVERLLKWMSEGNVVSSTKHVHFYVLWLREILLYHGMKLKGRTDVAILTGVQQILAHHTQLISAM
ncbi:unnamed protein product [Caenorhabditis bovis]|uniref:Small-subunit processome Utp12 domain-containing protein n=1 Tax=Caenorhabditis bovis TaxID=2654633 RepID=A0A8S1EE94_9PELO|nr:unnamed protein product [Caenorhabditis bovis]